MLRDFALRIGRFFGSSDETSRKNRVALVLSGGGARGAYQAGVLRQISEWAPNFQPDVITGVSAGALNAVYLASEATGPFRTAVESLCALWSSISGDQVYESEHSLLSFWRVLGRRPGPVDRANAEDDATVRGMVDTAPLRDFLFRHLPTDESGSIVGIDESIRAGKLDAIALLTANYSTGQTNAWIQGRGLQDWDRALRRSIRTTLTVEHVMASAALPIFFPAVRLGDTWHGDGGIRLSAPLAPAIHLGASKILAISTRHQTSMAEADQVDVPGYPPIAQVLGVLMNAVFLDILDQDALAVRRINGLLSGLPRSRWNGMRPVNVLLMRPSRNLDKLAGAFLPTGSVGFRFFMRLIGSGRTEAPSWLSMLNFEPEYVARVMECGYDDARRRQKELEAVVRPE